VPARRGRPGAEHSRGHPPCLSPRDLTSPRGSKPRREGAATPRGRACGHFGFFDHQYIAVRHNDKDHEHVHVAINKIHPETFRIHSPAWDHRKLFNGARALEMELGLTPLRSRARDRANVPQRAADCEAHQGIESFARWARENLRPALRAPSCEAGTTYMMSAAVLASCFGHMGMGWSSRTSIGVCGSRRRSSAASSAKPSSANSSDPSSPRPRINWKPRDAGHISTRPCRPGCRRPCGRSTSRRSTKRVPSAKRRGPAIASTPFANVDNSSRSIAANEPSSAPYPCQAATENDSCNNSHSGKPSKAGPSSGGSQSNGRRFKEPGIPAPGAISSPAAPPSATPVRFAF
jgi:hypothetical protein